MAGRRRASVAREVRRVLTTLHHEAVSIDWNKVFKASFMLLFVSYPGTTPVHTGIAAVRRVMCCTTA